MITLSQTWEGNNKIKGKKENKMKSEEFVVKGKNALVKIINEKYNGNLKADDLRLVWIAKDMPILKYALVNLLDNKMYYECTYNEIKDELSIDIYEKKYNVCLRADKLTE